MRLRIIAALFLSVLISAPAFALGPVDIDLEVGGLKSGLSGEAKYKGDSINLEDDLGLKDDEISMFVRGRLHVMMLGNLYAAYTPVKYEGDHTLTKSITFGDQTFNASGNVSSKVDLKMYDVGWTMTLIDAAVAEIELGVNAKFLDGTVSVNSQTADFKAPVPMLKAVVRVNVPLVTGEVDAMGIAYGDNHFYDVTGQVKVSPLPFFYGAVGYRYIDMQVKDGSSKKATVKSQGPFVAVGFDF
ncbi:MAG: TIGR04219 family outer membrane beta-barrel protein [Nitrospirae bacterium]|jgi:outer membrane protein|nr:TIGR04219 family outer membrane beta-barrel protein [Nitrospirota bacterium]